MPRAHRALPFFFYGTLMDADVRALVLPASSVAAAVLEPATLAGWRRVVMRRRRYPVIVRHSVSRVDGLLMRGLDRGAVSRLLAFETGEYVPRALTVEATAGGSARAWVFVASRAARPSSTTWDLEAWRRTHKRGLTRRLRAGWKVE